MNKLYDKNLYFLSLITWCLNPLDFNYTKEGIEINYDDYKIVINGKIDSSSNFTYVLPKKKQDFIKNNFNNKLVVVTTVYDKYGYSGRTYYDKYIPIDKTNLFEDNDNLKILNFILDSKKIYDLNKSFEKYIERFYDSDYNRFNFPNIEVRKQKANIRGKVRFAYQSIRANIGRKSDRWINDKEINSRKFIKIY